MHIKLLFFIQPIHHLCGFGPPFGNEGKEGLFRLLFSGLQISPCHVHFYIVLVLVMKLPTNIFPVSCPIVLNIEEPFESGSSQGVLEHLRQHFFSSSQRLHSPHVHVFRWDLGQSVPSNLSKTSILNFGGNLMSGKARAIGNPWDLPSCEPF